MSGWTLYHNPNCTKSKQALALLTARNEELTVIEYLKNPLSESELMTLMSQLLCDQEKLVRVKEEDFINKPFDLSTAESIAKNLAQNPKLMERPVIVHQDRAMIGRPISVLEDYLS